MFSGIHILDSCLRAWGKGKHLELNAEHMLKLLIRNKKKQCIILSEGSRPLIENKILQTLNSQSTSDLRLGVTTSIVV